MGLAAGSWISDGGYLICRSIFLAKGDLVVDQPCPAVAVGT